MMDQVVFIEDGKISMQGSPAELQKTNEHYRALKMADEGIQLVQECYNKVGLLMKG